MLKHEEMIENVHRRIAQYEEEKKMKHSKINNLISAKKPDNEPKQKNEDGYIEVASGTERIETSHRMLRLVSTLAAGAVLVTGISATGIMLHKNKNLKPAVTSGESELNEAETVTQPAEIIRENPFSELLDNEYELAFPNLEFTDTMREKVTELFNSRESWKEVNNYNRFLHYDNGGTYAPLARRMILCCGDYCLQICDDNIIEYSVLENLDWKKTFYECDSLALINGIADIMESEFADNGVDFDEDVSDFMILASMEQFVELSDIQKRMLSLCMKGSSWKMETMQANRDSSLFDLSLVSTSSGRLDIVTDKNYINSNTGYALFTDKNGITYTCEDNFSFANNIMYIMSAYDYPGLETEITITDGDGKVLISSDDNNRASLENFIYYTFPSLLSRYENYHYPNDYAVTSYNIDISYKAGDTELRSVGYGISNFGEVGRVDYVLDPVYGRSPAGCCNYTMDFPAFDEKLDALLSGRQEEKTPENKEDKKPEEKKSEEVKPTAENSKNEEKPANNEQKQDKPVNSEEQGQNVNGDTEPAQVNENIEDKYEKPESYADDIWVPKVHTIVYRDEDYRKFENYDDAQQVIATCITHNNDALDKFVADVFEPMLVPRAYNDTEIPSTNEGYSIFRIYMSKYGYMTRDGYFIYDNGFISLCSYIYDDGEWQPSGAENYRIDYPKFEELLKEMLNTAKLSD